MHQLPGMSSPVLVATSVGWVRSCVFVTVLYIRPVRFCVFRCDCRKARSWKCAALWRKAQLVRGAVHRDNVLIANSFCSAVNIICSHTHTHTHTPLPKPAVATFARQLRRRRQTYNYDHVVNKLVTTYDTAVYSAPPSASLHRRGISPA